MIHINLERGIYYDKQNKACFSYKGDGTNGEDTAKVIIWQSPETTQTTVYFVNVYIQGMANVEWWGHIGGIASFLYDKDIHVHFVDNQFIDHDAQTSINYKVANDNYKNTVVYEYIDADEAEREGFNMGGV
jgi:hypothetical protein